MFYIGLLHVLNNIHNRKMKVVLLKPYWSLNNDSHLQIIIKIIIIIEAFAMADYI
jgi:hypothetical protein